MGKIINIENDFTFNILKMPNRKAIYMYVDKIIFEHLPPLPENANFNSKYFSPSKVCADERRIN